MCGSLEVQKYEIHRHSVYSNDSFWGTFYSEALHIQHQKNRHFDGLRSCKISLIILCSAYMIGTHFDGLYNKQECYKDSSTSQPADLIPQNTGGSQTSPVQEILVEDGRAVGVLTAKGHEVRASSVICHFDQKQLDSRWWKQECLVKTMLLRAMLFLNGGIQKRPICSTLGCRIWNGTQHEFCALHCSIDPWLDSKTMCQRCWTDSVK